MSPSGSSRIPRKAPTPTPTPITKRSQTGVGVTSPPLVLPKSRGGSKPRQGAPSAIPKPKASPPADRDKPLPSPPVAQVLNPSSPPKAQRTLVDAEVAGTPTSEEWPIISPENVTPRSNVSTGSQPSSKTVEANVKSASAPQRDTHYTGNATSRSRSAPLSTRSKLEVSPPTINTSAHTSEAPSREGSAPSQCSTSTPATVHAITTARDEALESPLARRVAVPPRISSKRTSLPISTKGKDSSSIADALIASSRRRRAKPGSTRWPLLDTKEDDHSPSAKPPLPAEQNSSARTPHSGYGNGTARPQARNMSEASNTYRHASSQHVSYGSASTCGLAAQPSLDDEPCQKDQPSTRSKRLSGHSVSSGLGPVLKIAEDADSVLLGGGSAAGDPGLPSIAPEKAPQERSLSALTGRISRQTMSRMSVSIGSRSSTPQPIKGEIDDSVPVKVGPMRSKHPLSKASAQVELQSVSSHVPQPLQGPSKLSRLPVPPSENHAFSASSECMTPHKHVVLEPDSSPFEESPAPTCSTSKETSNAQAWPLDSISPKADQVLGISADSPNSPTPDASPIARISPKDGSIRAKDASRNASRIGPSLIRSAQRNSRNMTTGGHPTDPDSTSSSRALPRRGEGSSGALKLRSTENVTPTQSVVTTELHMASESAADETSQHSRSNTDPYNTWGDHRISGGKASMTTKDTAARVKAKRSFRDFFTKREGKRAEKTTKPTEAKRASLTVPASTLAKRFRDSANFSKVNLTKAAGGGNESRRETKADQPVLHAQDSSSQGETHALTSEPTPATCSDTAVIVNKIVNRLSSLPDNSPDRLRGLEIAEAVLNSVDAYKQAKISAMKAKKHARDAELNAERAGVELERLQNLCEPDFDKEVLFAISGLVKGVDLIGREGTSSESPKVSAIAQ